MRIKATKDKLINDLIRESKELCIYNLELSLNKADKAYSLAVETNNKLNIGQALVQLGIVNIHRNEYALANEFLEEALDYYEMTRDSKIKYTALIYLGDLRIKINDYNSALEYYLNALSMLAIRNQSINERGLVLYRLGKIYSNLEYYDIAIEYFSDIEKLLGHQYDENGIKQQLPEDEMKYIKSYIAECYLNIGETDKGLLYIKQAINDALDKDNSDEMGYAFYIYGKYYFLKNGLEEAKIYYNRAIRKFNVLRKIELLVIVMTDYGIMLYEIDELDQALDCFKQCLKLIDNTVDNSLLLIVNRYLAKIYEQFENYKLAFCYYKRYSELKLLNDETWKTIKAKSIINKYEKMRSDIKLKELESINSELESLYNLGSRITAAYKKKEIIDAANRSIDEVIPVNSIGLGFLNKNNGLEYYYTHDKQTFKRTYKIDNNNSYIAGLFKYGKEMINNHFDFDKIESEFGSIRGFEKECSKSIISCPLLIKEDVFGIVILTSSDVDAYNKHDQDVLRILASYVSTAFNNFRKSQEIINKNNRLRELMEKDGLTKLYNRYSLNKNIERIIKRAKKYTNPFSIIMIDVDYFKEYNDNYGHVEGDNCLRVVAKTLSDVLGQTKSYVYRYGGDEFMAVILDESEETVVSLVEEIKKKISELSIEHKYSKRYNELTLSTGIATIHKEIDDYKYCFILADKALYEAKDDGRNTYQQIIV